VLLLLRMTRGTQVEGSPLVGGRSPSVWDVFASKSGNIQDGSNPSVATDFYNKYKDDIALMKAMGVKNFR
jgi:beta-glucosidase